MSMVVFKSFFTTVIFFSIHWHSAESSVALENKRRSPIVPSLLRPKNVRLFFVDFTCKTFTSNPHVIGFTVPKGLARTDVKYSLSRKAISSFSRVSYAFTQIDSTARYYIPLFPWWCMYFEIGSVKAFNIWKLHVTLDKLFYGLISSIFRLDEKHSGYWCNFIISRRDWNSKFRKLLLLCRKILNSSASFIVFTFNSPCLKLIIIISIIVTRGQNSVLMNELLHPITFPGPQLYTVMLPFNSATQRQQQKFIIAYSRNFIRSD